MIRRQLGFTIVELMVSMLLSLILLGGVLAVVQSSKVTYSENERISRLQEQGRAAVELVLRDLRAAGFAGCAKIVEVRNVLHNPTSLLWNFASPLQGFNWTSSGTWTPALDASLVPTARDGSDVIAIRTVRTGAVTSFTSVSMATSSSNVQVTKQAGDSLPPNRTMLISDCSASTVFMATTAQAAGSTTATLQHQVGANLGFAQPSNASADLGVEFRDGAQVVPIDTVIYYIRNSGTTRTINGATVINPSLWRRISSNPNVQELVEGIEGMQMLFGEDTTGTGVVGAYRTAAAVANWDRVLSVSIAVLVRSVEPTGTDVDTRTYRLLDTTLGPFNDRYERTLYTTTVTLRNETS